MNRGDSENTKEKTNVHGMQPWIRGCWACTNLSPASFAPADLPKQNFVLANPRNFLDVKVQGSGGFAKTVRGFASANDAGGRFVQAHFFLTPRATSSAVQHVHSLQFTGIDSEYSEVIAQEGTALREYVRNPQAVFGDRCHRLPMS